MCADKPIHTEGLFPINQCLNLGKGSITSTFLFLASFTGPFRQLPGKIL